MNISLIVPVYNENDNLLNIFNYFLHNFDKEDELIFIDDFSVTTKCLTDLKQIENSRISNVKVIRNLENRGVSYSRNKGIQNSTSNYVMFLDADDILKDNFKKSIEKKLEDFDENPDVIRFNHNLSSFSHVDSTLFNQYSNISGTIIDSYYLHSSCTQICKRSLLDSIKFDEKIMFGEDLLFVYELLSISENILMLNDPYYIYNTNIESVSNNHTKENIVNRLNSIVLVYDNILKSTNVNQKIYKRKCSREISLQLFKLYMIDKYEYKKVSKKLRKKISNHDFVIKNIFDIHSILIKFNLFIVARMLVSFYDQIKK